MSRGSPALWVVMPVHDEERALEAVVREWVAELRAVAGPFTLLVVDDGSRDGTPAVLARLRKEIPELTVVAKANTGHGPSCLVAYGEALARGAAWIFQIDSDGQCDPAYFESLWRLREGHEVVLGRRVRRDDGAIRVLISRTVSVVVWLATGRWLPDANVPYRLMSAAALRDVLWLVPADTALSNIALAYLLARRSAIRRVPIRFRVRQGGTSSLRLRRLGAHACTLFVALRRLRAAHTRTPQRAGVGCAAR